MSKSNESNFGRYKEKSASLWPMSDFRRSKTLSKTLLPNESKKSTQYKKYTQSTHSAQSSSGCDRCDELAKCDESTLSTPSKSGCDACYECGTISGCVLRRRENNPDISDVQKIAILNTIDMFLNPTDLNPTDL